MGTLECSTGSTIGVTDLVNAVNSKVEVVEGSVTKTVASESSAVPGDFDFSTFKEAMEWVMLSDVSRNIELTLDDGHHYMAPSISSYVPSYVLAVSQLSIIGTSESGTILTIDPNDSVVNNTYIFSTNSKNLISYFKLNTLTIDPNAGGNIAIAGYRVVALQLARTSVYIENVTVSNCRYGVQVSADTIIHSYSTTFTDISTSVLQLNMGGSNVIVTDCTAIDSNTFIEFVDQTNGDNVRIVGTLTLTNTIMGMDTNATLNNGAVIYYGDSPWSGTTASRPDMTYNASGSNIPYFDTDLGKPIWYNGTAWVDSTGTGV